jgi:hypothetical protein
LSSQITQSIGNVIKVIKAPMDRHAKKKIKDESCWISLEGAENIETKP